MKLIFALISSIVVITTAQPALAYVDLNGFYFSDSMSTNATNSSTTMMIEASIGFAIDKKMEYLIGWNYGVLSVGQDAATSTKHSSSQMGPRFIWRFGKDQNWSLGVGYYLITKATDDSSGTSVDWKGSSIKADVGYSFDVGDALQFGVRANYLASSYNEQLANSVYTAVSYKRTDIYPSLYLLWIW